VLLLAASLGACVVESSAPTGAPADANAPAPPTEAGGSGQGSDETVVDAAPATTDAGADTIVASEASTEATTVDAPVAVDAATCPGILCEDFERGSIDPTKWDIQTKGGTVAVESMLAAHGKYAVQFHGQDLATTAQDYAFIITKNGPAELRVHHFGRAYFYITPKPRSGHTGMVFAGTTGFPKPTYLEVANINGGWQLGFVKLMGSPGGEEVAYPPGQVPAMTWSCLEWEFNDEPDAMTLWVDSKQLGVFNDQDIAYPPGHVPGSPIFDGKSSGLVGGFTDFGFGFYDWHPVNSFDLYYDDIVLDTKRVGCL
jgi:hypothetical protein